MHGTTQTAEGFGRLIDSLVRRGHRPLTFDVPSAAANSSVIYANSLAEQLPADLNQPVVAAHSASALLMPAVAGRLGAIHQVWMAVAVVDFVGVRSLLTEVTADPAGVFHNEWVGIDPTADPVLATYFLFGWRPFITFR